MSAEHLVAGGLADQVADSWPSAAQPHEGSTEQRHDGEDRLPPCHKSPLDSQQMVLDAVRVSGNRRRVVLAYRVKNGSVRCEIRSVPWICWWHWVQLV